MRDKLSLEGLDSHLRRTIGIYTYMGGDMTKTSRIIVSNLMKLKPSSYRTKKVNNYIISIIDILEKYPPELVTIWVPGMDIDIIKKAEEASQIPNYTYPFQKNYEALCRSGNYPLIVRVATKKEFKVFGSIKSRVTRTLRSRGLDFAWGIYVLRL